MAGARKKKDRWYGWYLDLNGNEHGVGGANTKPEAYKLAITEELRISQGTWIDPADGKQTVKTYIENVWWPNKRTRIQISTQQSYWHAVRKHLIPAFGHLRMEQVSHSIVEGWMSNMLNDGQTPANVVSNFRILRIIMNAAVHDRAFLVSPLAAVKPPPVTKKQWRILQPGDEAEAFEREVLALDDPWRTMILLEMELGARFSELRAIRPRHLNELRSQVNLCETVMCAEAKWLDENLPKPGFERLGKRWYRKPFTKEGANKPGDGSRVVEIDSTVMRMVLDYVKVREIGPDDLIFTTVRGLPIDNSGFNAKVWKPLLDRVGLDGNLRPHDLRHSAASWALDGGASLAEVMEIMGHKQISTTQLYLHALPDAPSNFLSARKRARERRAQ